MCVFMGARARFIILFFFLPFFFFMYLLFTHAKFWWTVRNCQAVVHIRRFPWRMNNAPISDSINVFIYYNTIILFVVWNCRLDKEFDLLWHFKKYIGIFNEYYSYNNTWFRWNTIFLVNLSSICNHTITTCLQLFTPL